MGFQLEFGVGLMVWRKRVARPVGLASMVQAGGSGAAGSGGRRSG